ncbi:MAG: O-antigen ligase family protein [Deltaproteobacteria bacterium]|nr:O-antigen ligase family protein [Deltaproteobacteria bacterium]
MKALPFVLLAVFLLTVLVNTRTGIFVAVLIRPVIDCFYEARYAIFDIKPTELLGVLLPLIVFVKLFVSKEHGFVRAPLAYVWFAYMYLQLFGTAVIITVGGDALLGMGYFFRAFNGFIGYFLFQEFFRTQKEFRILLIIHLVAGIVPLGMSVYQNLLGGVIRSEATIGGLIRNIGFYHDAYTIRLYCFQTLAALLLYWSYFLKGTEIISRAVLITMGSIILLTIYKIFSKAGYLSLISWFTIWVLARRKILVLVGVLIMVLGVAMLGDSRFYETIETVYSKEFHVMEGKGKTDQLFMGRVGVWKHALAEFRINSLPLKLVGDGSPHTGAHNDFLRALLGTGILGLVMYLVLLGVIGYGVLRRYLQSNTPLNVMALMIFTMWIIDAIGLVPGAYPGYQIFAWGFIGLALRGSIDGDFMDFNKRPEFMVPINLQNGN